MAALTIGVAGCGGAGVAPAPSAQPARPSASELVPPPPDATATARLPHLGAVDVVDVIQAASSEAGQRIVAVQLRGEVGTSAVFRSLEIRAWAEAIEGSRCDATPIPSVLHPRHAEAVQPTLADQTRTAVVRSLGPARASVGAAIVARFRYGPVPSLNGDFDGWVSFHVPAASADGFCAFDVRGMIVIVAGETTTAELPSLRIDTRHADD